MKKFLSPRPLPSPAPLGTLLAVLCALFLASSAQAQWKTETYELRGGWNAIYLHGDATWGRMEELFTDPNVLEVWRWNPNGAQAQATAASTVPSPSAAAEWTMWQRGQKVRSLSRMLGRYGYLVRCFGSAADSYSVTLKQSPLPPGVAFTRTGANLLGFPSLPASLSSTFAAYFGSFDSVIPPNEMVHVYVGGELGTPSNPSNPIALLNSNVAVRRNTAYWFDAQTVSDFYGPLKISVDSNPAGLAFGRSLSVMSISLQNMTDNDITVLLASVDSEPSPAGQEPVAGSVPLTLQEFDATSLTWIDGDPLAQGTSVTIPKRDTKRLRIAIDRSAMGGEPEDLFASLLRFTDTGQLFQIDLPVTARVSSLTGLWVGDATISEVGSKVRTRAMAEATVDDGKITGFKLVSGGFGYDPANPPAVSFYAYAPSVPAAAKASVAGDGTLAKVTLTSVGSGYSTNPADPTPGVEIEASLTGEKATAEASIYNGVITGILITDPGAGYDPENPPAVTIGAPPTSSSAVVPAVSASTATATAGDDGTIAAIFVSGVGSGYFYAPAGGSPEVTVDPPDAGGTTATASAIIEGGVVTGIVIDDPGSGYTPRSTPGVTIEPPASSTPAAEATVANGAITAIALDNGGLGYLSPPLVVISAPTAEAGTATPRTPALRILLHIDGNNQARLLSRVYLGQLGAAPHPLGLCTAESLLDPATLATSARLISTHLPPGWVGQPMAAGSGVPFTLHPKVVVGYKDKTNPFVHRYHPDHDNLDERRESSLPVGAESYTVVRELTLQFTVAPPDGGSATGWGSTTLGGVYNEVLTGLHKESIEVSGTFELRRASDTATLAIP